MSSIVEQPAGDLQINSIDEFCPVHNVEYVAYDQETGETLWNCCIFDKPYKSLVFNATLAKKLKDLYDEKFADYKKSLERFKDLSGDMFTSQFQESMNAFFNSLKEQLAKMQEFVLDKVRKSKNLRDVEDILRAVEDNFNERKAMQYKAEKSRFDTQIAQGKFSHICATKSFYDNVIRCMDYDTDRLEKACKETDQRLDKILKIKKDKNAITKKMTEIVDNWMEIDPGLAPPPKPIMQSMPINIQRQNIIPQQNIAPTQASRIHVPIGEHSSNQTTQPSMSERFAKARNEGIQRPMMQAQPQMMQNQQPQIIQSQQSQIQRPVIPQLQRPVQVPIQQRVNQPSQQPILQSNIAQSIHQNKVRIDLLNQRETPVQAQQFQPHPQGIQIQQNIQVLNQSRATASDIKATLAQTKPNPLRIFDADSKPQMPQRTEIQLQSQISAQPSVLSKPQTYVPPHQMNQQPAMQVPLQTTSHQFVPFRGPQMQIPAPQAATPISFAQNQTVHAQQYETQIKVTEAVSQNPQEQKEVVQVEEQKDSSHGNSQQVVEEIKHATHQQDLQAQSTEQRQEEVQIIEQSHKEIQEEKKEEVKQMVEEQKAESSVIVIDAPQQVESVADTQQNRSDISFDAAESAQNSNQNDLPFEDSTVAQQKESSGEIMFAPEEEQKVGESTDAQMEQMQTDQFVRQEVQQQFSHGNNVLDKLPSYSCYYRMKAMTISKVTEDGQMTKLYSFRDLFLPKHVFTSDQVVYVIGGSKDLNVNQTVNVCLELDFKNTNFRPVEKTFMLDARASFGCTISQDQNTIYVAGGYKTGNEVFNKCEMYNRAEDKWIPLPDLCKPKCSPGLCEFKSNGKTWLYCLGGLWKSPNSKEVSLLDEIERLDLGEGMINGWELLPLKLPEKICDIGIHQLNEKSMIIYGGWSIQSLNSVHYFEPELERMVIKSATSDNEKLAKQDFFLVNGCVGKSQEGKILISGHHYLHQFDPVSKQFKAIGPE